VAIDTGMTSLALAKAKQHVYNVCSQGADIVLVGSSTKDEFGALLTENNLTLKAFPIRFNPYDRETSEKISWSENTDILAYVPILQLDNLGLTVQQIQSKYKKFRHGNKTYDLRYIEPYSGFAGSFLYMVVGGKS
jgi:hypothetical protein